MIPQHDAVLDVGEHRRHQGCLTGPLLLRRDGGRHVGQHTNNAAIGQGCGTDFNGLTSWPAPAVDGPAGIVQLRHPMMPNHLRIARAEFSHFGLAAHHVAIQLTDRAGRALHHGAIGIVGQREAAVAVEHHNARRHVGDNGVQRCHPALHLRLGVGLGSDVQYSHCPAPAGQRVGLQLDHGAIDAPPGRLAWPAAILRPLCGDKLRTLSSGEVGALRGRGQNVPERRAGRWRGQI